MVARERKWDAIASFYEGVIARQEATERVRERGDLSPGNEVLVVSDAHACSGVATSSSRS